MTESRRDSEREATRATWTLRLAGGQEDANPSLWSPHVRSKSYGPAHLTALFARCRWLIVAVFLAVLTPALVWVLTTKPAFEVALRLFVKAERAGMAGGVTRPVAPAELAAEIEMIRSPELLRQVAEESGLSRLEEGVQALEADLRVAPIPESSVISIEYSHEDPEVASAVVSSLAELYLEERAKPRLSAEEQQRFEARTKTLESGLQAAQGGLEEFRESNRADLLESQNQAATSRSTQLEAEKASIETSLRDAERRLGLLAQQAEALPANVVSQSGGALNEPLVQELKELLAVLDKQRGELLATYEPTAPLVREIDRRMGAARIAMERAKNNVVVDETEAAGPLRRSIDGDYLRAQTELASLRARRQQIADSQRAADGRQWRVRQAAAREAELEAAVRKAEQDYLNHQKSRDDAPEGNSLDGRRALRVSVLEPATPVASPANRRQAMLLALSMLAAIAAAFGAAALYDPRVKPAAYVADIATAAGAPVLVMTEETQTHVS